MAAAEAIHRPASQILQALMRECVKRHQDGQLYAMAVSSQLGNLDPGSSYHAIHANRHPLDFRQRVMVDRWGMMGAGPELRAQ